MLHLIRVCIVCSIMVIQAVSFQVSQFTCMSGIQVCFSFCALEAFIYSVVGTWEMSAFTMDDCAILIGKQDNVVVKNLSIFFTPSPSWLHLGCERAVL